MPATEISSRGKRVIRSSSHPPQADEDETGSRSLDRAEPDDLARSKRTTPAERPSGRRRRLARLHQVQQGASEVAAPPRPGADRAGDARVEGVAGAGAGVEASPPRPRVLLGLSLVVCVAVLAWVLSGR